MNSSDLRRFGGINRLYGEAAREKLAQEHVCVVGLGGVGSWCAEALARTGLGRLTLIDGDTVAESNINRQLPALSSTIGRMKAQVLAERFADINPEAKIECITEYISAQNIDRLIPREALIIDAIDSLQAKAHLIAWAREHDRKIIVSGGAGGRVDPSQIQSVDLARVSSDALLSKLRARLRKEHGFPKGAAKPSQTEAFGITAVFSSEAARPCAADAAAAAGAAAGFGTSIVVTASMGLRLASEAIAELLGQ